MTELKRPTICYTTRIRAGKIKGVVGGGIDVYSKLQMDSFLSECAEMLQNALSVLRISSSQEKINKALTDIKKVERCLNEVY